MKMLPLVFSCLACAVVSTNAQSDVVSSVERTESLLNENQTQFLPISPPSTNIYIHKLSVALPVDWAGFSTNITSRLYADMVSVNSNLYPIYTLFIKEDPITRDRILYNSVGNEVWRNPAPVSYNPYLYMLKLFRVDSIYDIDPLWRWVFDPAHIALEILLIPELFHENYLADYRAEIPPYEPPVSQPITSLTVGIRERADSDITIKTPADYSGLFDIAGTTNLVDPSWEVVLVGEVVAGVTNVHEVDEEPMAPPSRFFMASPGEFDTDSDLLPDAHEYLVFSTDPHHPDVDDDGILDGDETHSNGEFGDLDGFVTDPFRADRADFDLPPPQAPGPSADFSGFDEFVPPSGSPASPGAPAIAEWTRMNDPGDTMALTGDRFSANEFKNDSRFMFFSHGDNRRILAEGRIKRLDGPQAALAVPVRLPKDKMYLLWPGNQVGFGEPVAINRAEAWWVGSDRLAKGEPFSVYGRNLTIGNGKSYVYIEELDEWLTSVSANPYKADFVLPDHMANGSYTIWAHNGQGREYGWALPKSLSVVSKVVWSGGTYNVKNYGAKGDGSTDDFTAIANAINAAASDPWSTVYFPAGTYRVAGRLPMKYKSKIRYQGDGMDKTTITPHPNHASSSYSSFLVYNSSDDSKFQDLTFAANQYGGNKLFYARTNYRIDFERVRFSQVDSPSLSHSLEVVDLHNGNRFSFKDCKFILTGRLFFGGAWQVKVENCDFYGINDNNTIMSCWGGEEVSIFNSTGQNYDESDPSDGFGWAKGRFFHSLGTWGSTHKIYFGDNRTTNMTPRDAAGVDQNSGEAFMCEGENVKWRAYATAATADSVTLPGLEGNVGNAITIIGGQGFGQSREVAASESGVLTVDEPWTVIPDTTSLVVVGDYTRRIVVYNNYFDGTPRAVNNESHIAATGVEPYGGAIDWIVVSNTIHELRQGFDLFARYKDNVKNTEKYVGCPHYFNTYQDNLIDGCRFGMKIYVDKMIRTSNSAISDVSYVGAMYRNNVFTNILLKGIRMETKIPEGHIDLSIYDSNVIHTKDDGASDDDGQRNHVWIRNTFIGENGATGMLIEDDHNPAFRSNTWRGFDVNYAGGTPGAVLELPNRVADAVGSFQDLPVQNSGTEPLFWVALADSPWLTLISNETTIAIQFGEHQSASGGMIEDETIEQAITFEINKDLAQGQAIITVLSEDMQVQELIVNKDGSVDSGVNAAMLRSDAATGEAVASKIREWIYSSSAEDVFFGELSDRYFIIPNKDCLKNRNLIKAWFAFWASQKESSASSFYSKNQWISNYRRVSDCCIDWDNFWVEGQNTDLWDEWRLFWEAWERCECQQPLIEPEKWGSFKSFWQKEQNRDKCSCWQKWHNWEYWVDFWEDSRNWKQCRNWTEFKTCWKAFLIRRKVEDLLDGVESWGGIESSAKPPDASSPKKSAGGKKNPPRSDK